MEDTITGILWAYIAVSILISIIVSFSLEKGLKRRLPATKPYKWGFYVGSMGVACAPLALLCALAALGCAASEKWEMCGACILYALYCALLAVCGWYTIRRRRWAWVLMTIFNCNIILWIAHYYYGRNRWEEFGAEALTQPYTTAPATTTSAPVQPLAKPTSPAPTRPALPAVPRTTPLYLYVDNDLKGPYLADQIKGLLAEHVITRETPCCHEGAPAWQTVADYIS